MRDLSLHLMDIVQNSVKAQATAIEIEIEAKPGDDQLILAVRDNGCGMPPDMVVKVQDPFVTSRTTRSVGLGISLLKELCELTG
ncbi:MAG: ATP-binding protein, partial [Clostridia bacterium]|nr:ATP-binding protein [Clostridia bacterium]